MSGKSVNADADIPSLVVEAVQKVATDDGVDVDDVKTEKVKGARVGDSMLTDVVTVREGTSRRVVPVPRRGPRHRGHQQTGRCAGDER